MRREALEAEITGRYGEAGEGGLKPDTFAARTQKRREDLDTLAQVLAAGQVGGTDSETATKTGAAVQASLRRLMNDPALGVRVDAEPKFVDPWGGYDSTGRTYQGIGPTGRRDIKTASYRERGR